MGYRIKYGGFEIECDTAEDVRQLIGAASDAPTQERVAPENGGAGGSVRPPVTKNRDDALLRALLEAGESGVDASVVAGLLDGARGRGVPFALQRWAVRVGLTEAEDNDMCVPARPGGKRGWRLSSHGLAAARHLNRGGGAQHHE